MNLELERWSEAAIVKFCEGVWYNKPTTTRDNKEKTNMKLILLNPLAILIYAHVALIVIFKLLGWEE